MERQNEEIFGCYNKKEKSTQRTKKNVLKWKNSTDLFVNSNYFELFKISSSKVYSREI